MTVRKLLAAVSIAALLVGSADAQNGGNGRPNTIFIQPLQFCQFQVSNTATTIGAATPTSTTTCTIPARTAWVRIDIETVSVRSRDDGTAPTASIGNLTAAGATMYYNGDLSKLQFIATANTATIDVAFYDGPGLP